MLKHALKFFFLFALLWATDLCAQQMIQKLPGDNYRNKSFNMENGDTIWNFYYKSYISFEENDSIMYTEVYKIKQFWKVYRYEIKDGEPIVVGIQREYDQQGRLSTELFCEEGQKKCPVWITYLYYPNGSLNKKGWFYEGKADKEHRTWYDNGQLRSRTLYDGGKLMEVFELWDRDGRALEVGDFKNGDGKLNIYAMNGNLIEVQTYNNGKRKKRTRVHNRVSDFNLTEREN